YREPTKRRESEEPWDSGPLRRFLDCLSWREISNWRRERDSNPRRAFGPYTLSRGAPSTTRPSLRDADSRCANVILLGEREIRDARCRAPCALSPTEAIFAATGERLCRSVVLAVFLRLVRA